MTWFNLLYVRHLDWNSWIDFFFLYTEEHDKATVNGVGTTGAIQREARNGEKIAKTSLGIIVTWTSFSVDS